ncbi:aspartate--tRNA ligase [Patescibacteria group bacterium]|nr:aspartate--tRNA ligase [Patescibacteria group bacterium]MBU4458736.1 aspartate--tRNA ligase [Patescibacteria group bacterium]MCG2696037.1 aspartate--tRNA ligase [Candidatus Portnoybacteria bacterium]
MERIAVLDTIKKTGEKVKVCGWVHSRRDHGKLIFIDLRDRSGLLQVVFSPEMSDQAGELRSEWVISIEGRINERPGKMINKNLKTGTVEMQAEKLEILNKAQTPPFALDTDGYEVNEEGRLKYRYLDIRRQRMKENLILRHEIAQFMRNFLSGKEFIEIETPILTKSTPEGARDYIVPSRISQGNFYALPQSPQQYKQLLMVAGIEKYFQITRCFRDEDSRGDRQPEFTQMDLEMSFSEQEDILSLIEELYIETVKKLVPEKHITKIPFPRLTYKEAMKEYKSDKPDLRKDKEDKNELAFAFIVDFPAFEWKESEKRWDAVHHPFTKVQNLKDLSEKEFIKELGENPDKFLAHQYDFVCNGYEIAGGSIREHNPRILEAVFEIMGNKKEDIKEKFGHLLEAFEYGVPPHGGIAAGIDRFIMILRNEPSIREVIAFPKTGDGRDLMMNAPSGIDKEQLKELGISIKKK